MVVEQIMAKFAFPEMAKIFLVFLPILFIEEERVALCASPKMLSKLFVLLEGILLKESTSTLLASPDMVNGVHVLRCSVPRPEPSVTFTTIVLRTTMALFISVFFKRFFKVETCVAVAALPVMANSVNVLPHSGPCIEVFITPTALRHGGKYVVDVVRSDHSG